MSDNAEISPNDLILLPHQKAVEAPSTDSSLPIDEQSSFQDQVEAFEARLIGRALKNNHSLRAAAKALRMDPTTLLRKKKKYEGYEGKF